MGFAAYFPPLPGFARYFVSKYNHNHDQKTGQFTGPAGALAAANNDRDATIDKVLKRFPPEVAHRIQDVRDRLDAVRRAGQYTEDKYSTDKGATWSAERHQLQLQIIKKLMPQKDIEAAMVKPGETPEMVILGGRGGSGKSFFTEDSRSPLHGNGKHYLVLDADKVKGELPEYQGWNAAQVHEESSYIMKQMINLARDAHCNVVLDVTMENKASAQKKIDQFKAAGYDVKGYYMHLPRQEAAYRAIGRFMAKDKAGNPTYKGRFVPPEVVLGSTQNEHNFDQLRRNFSDWAVYNNYGRSKEQGPERVAYKGRKGGKR